MNQSPNRRRSRDKKPAAVHTPDVDSEEARLRDEHREWCRNLQSADREAQTSYDKLVIALAGGGLGVSLAVLKDMVGGGPTEAVRNFV